MPETKFVVSTVKDKQCSANALGYQPLVLEHNCVRGPSGRIYCLQDDENGMAHIESGRDRYSSTPFTVGYNSEIKVVTSYGGYETIYVWTLLKEGVTYRIKTPWDAPPLENQKWRDISRIEVPYNIGRCFDSGCNGTGWFFDDDTVIIRAERGALFVGDYIITPELVTKFDDGDHYHELAYYEREIRRIKDILDCALGSVSPAEIAQIKSVQELLATVEPTLYVGKGPFSFRYADIKANVRGGSIAIESRRASDEGITHLNVTIDPDGWLNDITFDINRLGMIFTYYLIENIYALCGSESPAFIALVTLTPKEKKTYTGLLQKALEQVSSDEDKQTIQQVIHFINSPPALPSWVK